VRDVVLEFDHDNIFQKDKIVSSQYRGRFDIESQGTLENIKVMIDKCVVGNVPMMAIMTFYNPNFRLALTSCYCDVGFVQFHIVP